jgi:CIC family chloride channel protein
VQHGPREDEKKTHADLSEQVTTVDLWADIVRKTLMVAVVSFSVWMGCSLMRHGVELGTHGLFGASDAQGAKGFWLGAGTLLGVMLLAGILRGLLLRRLAWRDAEGDGIDKALVRFHETYEGEGDDPTPRYTKPTFSNAVRKMVMTVLTIGAGGSGGLEAPGVYLGESLGAGWSRLFKRPSADELRLYQLAGVAAAIATLLAAPFTAAIFAAEIVYAGRIIYRKLAYCLIAGVLAYEFNVHLGGHGTLFTAPEHSYVFVWQEYLLVILVAVGFSAPAAMALGPIIRGAERFFSNFSIIVRAAAGALVAGTISIPVISWVSVSRPSTM